MGPNASQADILDLGCGTGLFGVAARPWCHSLVGVDVSPGMLAVAASKSAYEDLVAADLLDHLRACDGDAFNAIVAADVLCYLGDLTELFEQAHRICRAGGIFGFSVENDFLATADYQLRSTGRFAHRVGYVRALAQRFGFAERVADQVTIRFENGSPVIGMVFLLAKPG